MRAGRVRIVQSEITASSNMASQLLLAGHSVFVNCMTRREWQDMGATHESDLLYKAKEMRTNLKKLMGVRTTLLSIVLHPCTSCHVLCAPRLCPTDCTSVL